MFYIREFPNLKIEQLKREMITIKVRIVVTSRVEERDVN